MILQEYTIISLPFIISSLEQNKSAIYIFNTYIFHLISCIPKHDSTPPKTSRKISNSFLFQTQKKKKWRCSSSLSLSFSLSLSLLKTMTPTPQPQNLSITTTLRPFSPLQICMHPHSITHTTIPSYLVLRVIIHIKAASIL